jgi:hypothetical protein
MAAAEHDFDGGGRHAKFSGMVEHIWSYAKQVMGALKAAGRSRRSWFWSRVRHKNRPSGSKIGPKQSVLVATGTTKPTLD